MDRYVVDINSRVCCLAAPGDHEGAYTYCQRATLTYVTKMNINAHKTYAKYRAIFRNYTYHETVESKLPAIDDVPYW